VNITEQLQRWMQDALQWAAKEDKEKFMGKPVIVSLNPQRIFTRTIWINSYKTFLGSLLSCFTGYHWLRKLWGGDERHTYSANPIGLALIGKFGKPQLAWKLLQDELRGVNGDYVQAVGHLLGVSKSEALAFQSAAATTSLLREQGREMLWIIY
jgi:hypothetical protein